LFATARAGDGTIDAAACPYPLHELLTYLVVEHDLLLHGSNDVTLEVLEPRPAQDWDTELQAVVACDDGIWPIFYAVVARRAQRGRLHSLRPCRSAAAPAALLRVRDGERPRRSRLVDTRRRLCPAAHRLPP
jgi:hypothetical protein